MKVFIIIQMTIMNILDYYKNDNYTYNSSFLPSIYYATSGSPSVCVCQSVCHSFNYKYQWIMTVDDE